MGDGLSLSWELGVLWGVCLLDLSWVGGHAVRLVVRN